MMNSFGKRNRWVLWGTILLVVVVIGIGYVSGWFGDGARLSGTAGLINDPVMGLIYQLTCSAGSTGYYTAVDGLGSQHEVVSQRIVDERGREVNRLLPGRLEMGELTLYRSITADVEAWNWRQLVVDGKIQEARQDCELSILDQAYNQVAVWRLVAAWPAAYFVVSDEASGLPVEALTLVYERLERTR